MANPTTNYGFVLPTSTDLVTDLPADFDVALQGVDTRLKALNPSTTLGDTDYASATANTNTRLAIGSTGQVLTVAGGVPTWATPSSGFNYINSFTFSNVASLSMSSIFSATYDYYRIVTDFTLASAGDFLNIRLRSATTDNTTSNYFSSIVRNESSTVSGTFSNAATGFDRMVLCGLDSTIISFDITNPFSSSIPTFMSALFGSYKVASTARNCVGSGSAFFNANTSFDGLTLIPPTNFTGRAKVYGYSNS